MGAERVKGAFETVRKHRAPKGALRPASRPIGVTPRLGQKAPSAKRCIKTCWRLRCSACRSTVRKHRAPKGALRPLTAASLTSLQNSGQKAPSAKRCIKTPREKDPSAYLIPVRKHRAPKGALRPGIARLLEAGLHGSESTEHQKVH